MFGSVGRASARDDEPPRNEGGIEPPRNEGGNGGAVFRGRPTRIEGGIDGPTTTSSVGLVLMTTVQ